MNHSTIPYRETGVFTDIVIDYLEGSEALQPFYAYAPEVESVPEIIRNISDRHDIDRSTLVQTLREQYEGFDAEASVRDNIGSLASDRTFTVTTAHQLNIFTGPLYYIYKILNAVRVARDLGERYPDYRFVPCYWMGSEDHDFEEVNHLHLFGKTITWENFQGGCLGRYSTEGLTGLLPGIREILRDGQYLDDLIALMKNAYTRPDLAGAVRDMLNRLFGRYGLVVVDANCDALKSVFKPVLLDELENQSSKVLVKDRTDRLSDAGYRSQAFARDINLFLLGENSRERIVRSDTGFGLADSEESFTSEAMTALVENAPGRFSPNVILRPLHQQMVLPNIAYIGGGSEIAYWLQLRPLFEHHGVHFPMLLLRTSAAIFAPHVLRNLEKLELRPADVFHRTDMLKKRYVEDKHDDLNLEAERRELGELFDALKEKAGPIDASLEGWIGAEGQKSLKSLDNISKRLIRAAKSNDEQNMARIDKVKEQMFPDGSLQERYENFMSWYSDNGPAWLDDLLETLDPFSKEFYLIR